VGMMAWGDGHLLDSGKYSIRSIDLLVKCPYEREAVQLFRQHNCSMSYRWYGGMWYFNWQYNGSDRCCARRWCIRGRGRGIPVDDLTGVTETGSFMLQRRISM
jgi:hypothetical protein